MTWTQVFIYAVLAWTARAVYKDAMRAVQTFPTHLRFRRPVDGGEGRESETGLVECPKPAKVKRQRVRHGSGDDLSNCDDVVREQMRKEKRERHTFEGWMDARGIHPPTVFEYEALREHWRRNQMALPTPAENARRYAAEGGTW